METRHIKFLRAVAESGSISAASRSLGMTQSALTKIVARVEDELGAKLFIRKSRGVDLSAYGRAFLQRAQRIGAEMDDLVAEMRSIRTGMTGTVTFGAGEAWERDILPPVIETCRERFPRLALRVRTGSAEQLMGDLWQGHLDFLLVQMRPEFSNSSVVVEPIRDTVLMPTVRKGHPLDVSARRPSAAALVRYPWILPPSGDPARDHVVYALTQRGAGRPEIAVESSSLQLRARLLMRTDMVTLMPDVRGTLYAKRLSVLKADWCTHRRPAGIVSVSGRNHSKAALNFLDVLREAARSTS